MPLLACLIALAGCAGHKERLAKCSADENPVGELAYGQQPGPSTGGIIVQQMSDECGPMRPVNQL
ncbi:hypothetical protein DY251_18710 [Mesorhizobium denitrificans]|uniref:Uncharacterized protein n=1 Tax=Mesorhizobium denitrificans TaxID=2294114 RepID=A0A371X6I4_9HYPH|nr:hypothetical protein DY251_18710 [Mesorhizobium denitrificans]